MVGEQGRPDSRCGGHAVSPPLQVRALPGDTQAAAPPRHLPVPEVLFRCGLLLGAILFFHENLGPPWERNLFGLAGIVVAVLLVLTMTIRLRVLGDWTSRSQWPVYTMLMVALAYPVAAAISPAMGASALPDSLEVPVTAALDSLRLVPGMGAVLALVKGFISFLFLAGTLLALVIATGPAKRGILVGIATILTAIVLFFHPSAETVVGFMFLYLLFYFQWEIPLILPDRVRAHLLPAQREYLLAILRQGSLTTGETRLYLDNNPAYFAELLDLKLVDYDAITREVGPGPRLLHDPAGGAIETATRWIRGGLWIVLALIYFIMPDILPGPVDDLVVLALCSLSGIRAVMNK